MIFYVDVWFITITYIFSSGKIYVKKHRDTSGHAPLNNTESQWCLQTAVNLNVQVFRKNIRSDSIYLAFCMIIIITRKVRLRLFGHAPTPLK